jgi:hypothetical protein
MPVGIALNHFLGKDGTEKKNCAQAVLCAFQEPLQIPDGIIESFKEHGGGRAPEGMCGAAYAAEFVLGMAGIVDENTNVVAHLETLAGSAKCKEIKAHKKLSCVNCVEQCTAYLSVLIG